MKKFCLLFFAIIIFSTLNWINHSWKKTNADYENKFRNSHNINNNHSNEIIKYNFRKYKSNILRNSSNENKELSSNSIPKFSVALGVVFSTIILASLIMIVVGGIWKVCGKCGTKNKYLISDFEEKSDYKVKIASTTCCKDPVFVEVNDFEREITDNNELQTVILLNIFEKDKHISELNRKKLRYSEKLAKNAEKINIERDEELAKHLFSQLDELGIKITDYYYEIINTRAVLTKKMHELNILLSFEKDINAIIYILKYRIAWTDYGHRLSVSIQSVNKLWEENEFLQEILGRNFQHDLFINNDEIIYLSLEQSVLLIENLEILVTYFIKEYIIEYKNSVETIKDDLDFLDNHNRILQSDIDSLIQVIDDMTESILNNNREIFSCEWEISNIEEEIFQTHNEILKLQNLGNLLNRRRRFIMGSILIKNWL